MKTSLKDKIVLITGASAGIGAATAEQFAAEGAKVILAARRVERLEKLVEKITQQYHVPALALEMDVSDQAAVAEAINHLPAAWQSIDVLVNNAGMAVTSDPLQQGKPEDWDKMIDVNLKGLLYVTHAVLSGMLARKSGHIINVGSIAGREHYPGANIYSPTKHAVRAISKQLMIDLLGTGIRTSEVAPGMVQTEFSEVRWGDKKRSDDFYNSIVPLQANDIADAIVYCATRPAHVNIAEMVVLPTCQASVNHVYHQGEKIKGPFDK